MMNDTHIKNFLLRISQGGTCTDDEFDQLYPDKVRHLSYHYWSTFNLSAKAAILSCYKDKAKILDLGSGSGKFCLVGSLVTNGQFYGVEKRKYLTDIAKNIGALCPGNKPKFIHGDLAEIDWKVFDSIFMFNPLTEYRSAKQMDEYSQYNLDAYNNYMKLISCKLDEMTKGTRFVAVCEFAFKPPKSYEKIHASMVDGLPFGVWQKI